MLLLSCYFWKFISFYCRIAHVLLSLIHFQIGEVVDGPDDGMKRPVLDGIEYDYGQHLVISCSEPHFPYSLEIHLTFYLDCYIILLSVFDVDIGDGEPIRKLPYNLSGKFLRQLFCLLMAVDGLVFSESSFIPYFWFLERISWEKNA